MKFFYNNLIGRIIFNIESIISRASIYGSSIFKDNGNNYVFGSHIWACKSSDIIK